MSRDTHPHPRSYVGGPEAGAPQPAGRPALNLRFRPSAREKCNVANKQQKPPKRAGGPEFKPQYHKKEKKKKKTTQAPRFHRRKPRLHQQSPRARLRGACARRRAHRPSGRATQWLGTISRASYLRTPSHQGEVPESAGEPFGPPQARAARARLCASRASGRGPRPRLHGNAALARRPAPDAGVRAASVGQVMRLPLAAGERAAARAARRGAD
jgi:hypothetical protein